MSVRICLSLSLNTFLSILHFIISLRRFHLECLSPPLEEVPVEEWFCPECAERLRGNERAPVEAGRELRRRIPRTRVAERVRTVIRDRRLPRVDMGELTVISGKFSVWVDSRRLKRVPRLRLQINMLGPFRLTNSCMHKSFGIRWNSFGLKTDLREDSSSFEG